MSNQSLTGIFVRLPLSEDHARVFLKESVRAWDKFNGASDAIDASACEAGLIAIGTRVTGEEPACCGSVKWHYNDLEPVLDTYNPNLFEKGVSVKIVTLSDHLAALASLQAEVGQKSERITELEEELSGFRAGMSELIAKEVATLKGPEA